MPDADNHAGERSPDLRDSGQQNKTSHKGGRMRTKKSGRGESSTNARGETPKDIQVVRSDKMGSRTARGPEDWGGYDGY